MPARAIVRHEGEGDRRWFFGGGTHTWKVTSAESDGAFFLYEDEMTQGKMTPWHCHPDTDETIVVLEGEVRANLDGVEHTVTAGGMWLAPRGLPHAFTVVSPTARLLAFQTPGAADAFYLGASEPASAAAGDVDFTRVRAMAEQTGATSIMGPPPFASS